MRNLVLSAVFAGLSLFGATASAEDIQAGKQYVELGSPVPVAQPGKIEVVELFWYGCPHCYQFEPSSLPLGREAAAKTSISSACRRCSAASGTSHGQVFMTLESDGRGGTRCMRRCSPPSTSEQEEARHPAEEIAEFLAGQGVDKDVFLKTFNSFAVKGQMEKAKKLAMAYQITGVPVMVVNGKYRFDLG